MRGLCGTRAYASVKKKSVFFAPSLSRNKETLVRFTSGVVSSHRFGPFVPYPEFFAKYENAEKPAGCGSAVWGWLTRLNRFRDVSGRNDQLATREIWFDPFELFDVFTTANEAKHVR